MYTRTQARFAETVAELSTDLDANFKLKFGQVVIRARRAPLVPQGGHKWPSRGLPSARVWKRAHRPRSLRSLSAAVA